MKMKKLIAMLLALIMVMALVGCGSSSSSSSSSSDSSDAGWELTTGECEADIDYSSCDLSDITIGYVTINTSAPWGGRVGTMFCQYAEECGASVSMLDGNTDSDLVNQYVQQYIDEGVDAIVVFGGTPADMSELAQKAYEAGIAMFLCALDADSETEGYEYVTAMIGPDQAQMCADIAAYVVEQNGEDYECTVYEINGVPFLQDYQDRTSGFQTYMADYTSYTLGNVVDAYADRTSAKSYTEDWIKAGLSEGDIIMGYDDDLTMGAVQALEEAGLTGLVKVYSLTGQADAIQAVIDGQLEMTVMNRADSIAAGTVTAIYEFFTTGTTTRLQRTELTYIPAENAADYLALAEF